MTSYFANRLVSHLRFHLPPFHLLRITRSMNICHDNQGSEAQEFSSTYTNDAGEKGKPFFTGSKHFTVAYIKVVEIVEAYPSHARRLSQLSAPLLSLPSPEPPLPLASILASPSPSAPSSDPLHRSAACRFLACGSDRPFTHIPTSPRH
jgi:hypothetical protein